ncbi:hypothetical protein ACIBG0_14760 [Nocardia sp. NPDC050630]|uniref:hypothetical protein n=1 Tax=Nocardia sp. NPDC050630 TaxID=3364321 RepID=UPI0037883927
MAPTVAAILTRHAPAAAMNAFQVRKFGPDLADPHATALTPKPVSTIPEPTGPTPLGGR